MILITSTLSLLIMVGLLIVRMFAFDEASTSILMRELGLLAVPAIALSGFTGFSWWRTVSRPKPAEQPTGEHYRTLFERSPVPMWLVDFSNLKQQLEDYRPFLGKNAAMFFSRHPILLRRLAKSITILDVNNAALELFGAPRASMLIKKLPELLSPEGYGLIEAFLGAFFKGETQSHCQGRLKTLQKQLLHVAVYWEDLPSTKSSSQQVILAIVDVSEQTAAKEALSATVREREVLIRELYHRTKNNMQSILSLLTFEAWKIDDPLFRDILRSLETRVYSMSLVHRMLYEYKDLSRLSLSAYLREFASYLNSSEQIEERGIQLELRLEEIEVTIDIAIPIGLSVAELVSNALSHAFPEGRQGVITIELRQVDDDHFILEVGDNGVGVQDSFNPGEDGSMGIQMIISLAESQLGGEARFEAGPDGGFHCRILVRPDLYEIRV